MPASRLRALLLIAGLGAVALLIDVLGDAGAFAGAGAMALGALGAAPARSRSGRGEVNWWGMLALGAALAVVGVLLGLLLEAPGGLLAGLGGGLVVVAVALGWP